MALATAEPNGMAAALYRPDFIETARGFHCVEMNGGNPGGWLISALAPLYLECPSSRAASSMRASSCGGATRPACCSRTSFTRYAGCATAVPASG